MNKRVFHVDQECFVIYAEELDEKKEKFLRIGSSPFLEEIGDKLTFVTLLSDICPGDPDKEIGIFKKSEFSRAIGLKKNTSNFINFLKNNKVNTEKIKSILVEEEDELFKKVKSEKDFLDKIKDNNSIRNHSFASFYNDGNIKIFNKNETIFDLKEGLRNTVSEKDEIKLSSAFFNKNYKPSYIKNGVIHSNKSLFIFSHNNFACITYSNSWIKDALRVGISPSDIDILYAAKNANFDSSCIKSLLNKDSRKRIDLLSKEKPGWINLIQGTNIRYADPFKDESNFKTGNINILFKKELITISYKSFNISLEESEPFLDKRRKIDLDYMLKGKKIRSNITIEDYDKDSLTLYSFNPLIFEDLINKSNYIRSFWDKFPGDVCDGISQPIHSNDNEYLNYKPYSKDEDFHSRLFVETVRRINYEDNKNKDDAVLNSYKDILKNFSGEDINENKVIIEQTLGFNNNFNRISIRDVVTEMDFVYLNKNVNPFLTFKNEESRDNWETKLKEYRDNFKKNIDDEGIEKAIRERFTEVLESKRFYIEEQNRLRRFLEELMSKERIEERQQEVKERDKIEKEAEVGKENSYLIERHEKSENQSIDAIKDSSNGKTKIKRKAFNFFKNSNQIDKRLLYGIAAIVVLFLILFFIFFINSDRSIIKKYVINKESMKKEKVIEEKGYRIIDNSEGKKSLEIDIKITILDVLNFTNLVAENNGYHKIVEEDEKDFIAGNDPDWIYPGNILILPDSTKITIREDDTMWGISEDYLTREAKEDEVRINEILFNYKDNIMDLSEAKGKLQEIKRESHLNILKEAIDDLLKSDDL